MDRQKKGGRKRAVSPQSEVRLKMATADFAIMRLTAQPHCKICIFSNVAPKILENAENAQKKERPEIAWFTVTMRRATGRPDVGEGRKRAADRPKNFNRFESHTQHLSNEDESGPAPPARSVRVQSLTLSCQGIIKTTTQSGSAASQKKKK